MDVLEKLAKNGGINKTFAEKIREAVDKERESSYTVKPKQENRYSLFSQQFLERPVVSGDYEMTLTPSASSWKNIPTIDDW